MCDGSRVYAAATCTMMWVVVRDRVRVGVGELTQLHIFVVHGCKLEFELGVGIDVKRIISRRQLKGGKGKHHEDGMERSDARCTLTKL
jgi:hypothetical protein